MSLYDRLAAALATPLERPVLEADLDPHEWPEAKPAAVLVAITEKERPGLLLTRRNAAMRTHAGQVAFLSCRGLDGRSAIPTLDQLVPDRSSS